MTTPRKLVTKSTAKPKIARKRVIKSKPSTKLKLNLDKLKEVASITHTVKEIAIIMGCAESTLYANAQYKKIIEDSRVTVKHSLKTQLLNLALAGDIKCLFYALNNYTEFTDKKETEIKVTECKIPTLAEMYKSLLT